tara:strand:- start:247 stop:1071 length:825 start_codon:yes stop_codon:yes gene_type:complete
MEKVKRIVKQRRMEKTSVKNKEPPRAKTRVLEKREVGRGVPTFHPIKGLNIPIDNPQTLDQGNFYHLNQRKNKLENELLDPDIEKEGIERESTYNALYELGQSRPPQPSQIDDNPYEYLEVGGRSVASAQWLRGNGFTLNNRADDGGFAYDNARLNKWKNGAIQLSRLQGNFIGSAKTNMMPLDANGRQINEQRADSIEKIRGRRRQEAEEYIDSVEKTIPYSGYSNTGRPQANQAVHLGVSIGGFQADQFIPKQENINPRKRETIDTTPIFSY